MSLYHEELSTFPGRMPASQSALYGFIYTALANGTDTSDVLQQNNRVFQKKAHTHDALPPLLHWAYQVAHF